MGGPFDFNQSNQPDYSGRSDQASNPFPETKPPAKVGSFTVQVSKHTVWFVGIILVMAAIGIGILVSKLNEKSDGSGGTSAKGATPGRSAFAPTLLVAASPTVDSIIKVYVTGEVQTPGVYDLKPGDRVDDAIQKAGGFTDQADKSRLELAQRVIDGQTLYVPRLAAIAAPLAPPGPGTPLALPTATPTPGNGKININTASAADLDKLPGIGEVLSQRIVDYRTQNGLFKSLDDLRKVAGLNKSVIDKIKDLITF